MFAFSIALFRFLKVLKVLIMEPEMRAGVSLLLFVLLLGTAFYHNVEGWGFLDAFYFCVTTLATVGFGDLSPQTSFGKVFTIIYIFLGMGLLVGIINVAATKRVTRGAKHVRNPE